MTLTKQQLLALLREAYELNYHDGIFGVYKPNEFIAEVERTNKVGDLELPVLGWQPLTETPKERKDLLLVCGGLVEQGIYIGRDYWDSSCQYKLKPTAWMYEPLPQQPDSE